MSALKFTPLKGVDGYEVRRDGVLLGRVEHVLVQVTIQRARHARLTRVKKWRFQLAGSAPSRLLYGTRAQAAGVLATFVDAHARAQKEVVP